MDRAGEVDLQATIVASDIAESAALLCGWVSWMSKKKMTLFCNEKTWHHVHTQVLGMDVERARREERREATGMEGCV